MKTAIELTTEEPLEVIMTRQDSGTARDMGRMEVVDDPSRSPLYTNTELDARLAGIPDVHDRICEVTLLRAEGQIDSAYADTLIMGYAARGKELSLTDALTGAYNRRFFDGHTDETGVYHIGELETQMRAAQRSGRPLSLLLIDADHFKQINDSKGHAAGDEVLQGMSYIFSRSIRAVSTNSRYGGDEFAILLPDTGIGDATVTAERLRKAIEKEMGITTSIGIAAYEPNETAEDFFKRADAHLYTVKALGRNTTVGIDCPVYELLQ